MLQDMDKSWRPSIAPVPTGALLGTVPVLLPNWPPEDLSYRSRVLRAVRCNVIPFRTPAATNHPRINEPVLTRDEPVQSTILSRLRERPSAHVDVMHNQLEATREPQTKQQAGWLSGSTGHDQQ